MIWLPIILTHIPIAGKLFYDYRQFLEKKAVNHGKEWLAVALLEVPVAYLFAKDGATGFSFMLLLDMLFAGGMIAFYFWFLFDGLYNLLRGHDWWFVGSPDTEGGWYSKDSWTEKLFRRTGIIGQIAIKLGGFILFTYLFFR